MFFDLSGVEKNIDIGRIVFSLYCTQNVDYEVFALLHLVSKKWDPDYATWEKATLNTNWDTEGGDYSAEKIDSAEIPPDAAGKWQDFIVTTVAKDFINNPDSNLGFYVKMSLAMLGTNYASSEYLDKTKRPKLKIMHGDGDYELPQVTVRYPNGGEVLIKDTKETIKWTATDNEKVVGCVVYFKPNTWTGSSILDSLDDNPGEYEWIVPEGDLFDCKIKVIAYDAVGNIGRDESDEIFEIKNPTGIIPHMFKTSLKSNYSVSVFNVLGREIALFKITDLTEIDKHIASLPSNLHIISIKTPDNRIIKKYGFVR